ncbi:MAG: hypothetical protein HZB59_11155 [Ignavibacteriales bacterium]|nr:hypothetical protein [Ignavibacteriales bacterium]
MTKYFIRSLYLSVIFLSINNAIIAQSDAEESFNRLNDKQGVQNGLVDYAVPDLPALKIFGKETEFITRPGTVRDISIGLGNLFQSVGALEISPALLLFKVSLSSYQQSPFLYRTRISVSVNSPANGMREVGWGLRFTIIDDADLRTDKILQSTLISVGRELDSLSLEWIKSLPIEVLSDSASFNEEYDKFLSPSYSNKIKEAREEAKKRNWNKPILEFAVAGSAVSPDSTLKRFSQSAYAFWLTGGFLFLEEDGQIVFGLNGLARRSESNKIDDMRGSFALRGYYGSNSIKGFIECDWKAVKKDLPYFCLNAGGELNLLNGVWVDCALGIIKQSNEEAKFTSSLNIKIATPEL